MWLLVALASRLKAKKKCTLEEQGYDRALLGLEIGGMPLGVLAGTVWCSRRRWEDRGGGKGCPLHSVVWGKEAPGVPTPHQPWPGSESSIVTL